MQWRYPVARLLHTSHAMLQTCCPYSLWSTWHGVVQYSLVLCLDIRDMNALTYAFFEFIYITWVQSSNAV